MLWWLQNEVQVSAKGDDRLVHFCFENDAMKMQNDGVLLAQTSPLGRREKIACFMCGSSSILSLTDGFLTLRKHFWQRYQPGRKAYGGEPHGSLFAVVEKRYAGGREDIFLKMKDGGQFKGVKTGQSSQTSVPTDNLEFWLLGGGESGGFDFETMYARRTFEDGKIMYKGRELEVWSQLAERQSVAMKDVVLQSTIEAVCIASKHLPTIMADRHRLHCGFIKERSSDDDAFSLHKGTNENADKETTAMVNQFLHLINNERFDEFAKMKSDDNTGEEARLGDRGKELKAIMACMGGLLANPYHEKDTPPEQTHQNASSIGGEVLSCFYVASFLPSYSFLHLASFLHITSFLNAASFLHIASFPCVTSFLHITFSHLMANRVFWQIRTMKKIHHHSRPTTMLPPLATRYCLTFTWPPFFHRIPSFI
jgi:hypothetical protein